MQNNKKNIVEDYSYLFGHTPTRPIRFVKDEEGFGWLCDKSIDVSLDLRKQGCWRCDEMAFPAGDR
ncbi:MAG: hypothetical protein JW882_12620 [Deltaproteobacteria bacterium]|nr:hypothetical protein [Deltaproteobacteria bacterium]